MKSPKAYRFSKSKIEVDTIDFKAERENDVSAVVNSRHPKILVAAGPGTGKSYLFERVIQKKKEEGKTSFLAITFMGKLGDMLADDLAGLAKTVTLHGFAREIFLKKYPKWDYYPEITKLIAEDLEINGINQYEIGDLNYIKRTNFYKSVGHDDIVYYALKILTKDKTKIPKFDLILVDEFQDFNEVEADFIDLLATENKVLIVGDDDQTLYEFKGSSPRFIREKYKNSKGDHDSKTLRFCSRCTEVMINAFHSILENYGLNEETNERIKKEYICYLPSKKSDSELNKKIILFENTELWKIPYKIKSELEALLLEQKIKSVLIIGEAQTCQKLLHSTANKLRWLGFRNVSHIQSETKEFSLKQDVVDAYKILFKGNESLAWRILIRYLENEQLRKDIILENYDSSASFISAIPNQFKTGHEPNSKVLYKILNEPPYKVKTIADSSIEKLNNSIVEKKQDDRKLLINQLLFENKDLPRPLSNIDVNVCTILGSKGLGSDVVFLVGFDQGKLPQKGDVKDSEIYQILVALTRAKKRIYLINTVGCEVSKFVDNIDENDIERIRI